MAFDKYFGFGLTERQTLEKLFAELEARIVALEEQVAARPNPTP